MSKRSLSQVSDQQAEQRPSKRQDLDGSNYDASSSQNSGIICPPIPGPLILTPFTPEEIATLLPPLPRILDPLLEVAVFTSAQVSKHEGTNYERLEWLGDAYAEIISSSLLFSTFGGSDQGKLSHLRELLIKNSTLGEFALQYGFMSRVKLAPEQATSKDAKKIPGDLMEAYIAAIILSDPKNGLQRAAEWLKILWGMVIKDQIKALAKNPEKHQVIELGEKPAVASSEVLPKTKLIQLIGVKGVNFRYEDDLKGPKKDKYNKKLNVFSVNLYMDGWGETNKWLGRGTDINKKEAGQKAAQQALDNHSLIKKYGEKKKAFDAARNAD